MISYIILTTIISLVVSNFIVYYVIKAPKAFEDEYEDVEYLDEPDMKLSLKYLIPGYVLSLKMNNKYNKRASIVAVFMNLILYVSCFITFDISIASLLVFTLLSVIVATLLIDYKYLIIPDTINVIIVILAVILAIIKIWVSASNYNSILLDDFFGFLVGGGTFYIIMVIAGFIYKTDALGFGDVKLMGALGLYFGFLSTLQIFLLSFLFGSVISIFLLITKIKNMKDAIPFGPFICLATISTIFWSQWLINWYMTNIFTV